MESTYVTVTIDELIIEFVKENPCVYNKSDANYKNVAIKKRVWQNLSENLKALYDVDMTADVIEKRWSSLRDMFNREHRKQKLPPSGSGYTPTKEWELYKTMLFLIPHLAHRRTKTSFPLPSQSTNNSSSASFEATNSCLSSNTLINRYTVFDNYSEDATLEGEGSSLQTEKDELETNPIEEDMTTRSTSTMSNYSSSSSNTQLSVLNTNSRNVKSPSLIFKPVRKVTPEPDNFAKRKKKKDDQIDRELAEVSSVISTAMNSVTSLVSDQKDDKDGYMVAVGEALKHVPGKHKTQCLIEMLQIIQKFEDRKE